MRKPYRILILSIVLTSVFTFSAKAQNVLTIEDAVKIALENNFQIKISTNDHRVDEKNISLANAGMLPSVNANVSNTNTVQDLEQTRQDGTVQQQDGARNFNINYGVSLSWTVFDGLRMFARYDQLKELEKLGANELRLTVLNTISDVFSTYYELVQLQQQLRALDSTITISKQRLNIAKNRYTIGKASKLEVLNAEVDLNTDITAQLRQKENYQNRKIRLNEILARDVKTDFEVAEDISIDGNLSLDELIDLAQEQNPQLQSELINRRIQELQVRQVKANRYPVVRVSSGYTFNRSEAPLGFTTQSTVQGFNYGFTATVPIFNGSLQNRNEKIANIQLENAEIAVAQQAQILQSQLASSFQTYLTNLELIALETQNEAIARENLDITLEKFNIGTIPAIEFRAAQVNYVNAKVRYTNAQYQAKLSEIALKELVGNLSLE